MISLLWRIRSFVKSLLAGPARLDVDVGHMGRTRRTLFLERRAEKRAMAMRSCQFNFMHSLSPDSTLFEEGTSVKVNQSKSGMLLLTNSAPTTGKLLEVYTEGSSLASSFSLVEVRWSKSVRSNPEGQLNLVGCRRTFGPSSYWAL